MFSIDYRKLLIIKIFDEISLSNVDEYLRKFGGQNGNITIKLRLLAIPGAGQYRDYLSVEAKLIAYCGIDCSKCKSYFCKNLCKMSKCCIEHKYYSYIECTEFMCDELRSEIKNKPEVIENLNKLKNSQGVNTG